MLKKKWFWFLVIVVLVAVAAGIVYATRGKKQTGTVVQTELVERMTIVQTVTATGRIQPKTQVNISADVSAKITQLAVDEGDRVEQGTFLLELDRERYLASVESAEASLRVSQSNATVMQENLVKARKDYDRIQELFRQQLETQAQLDSAQAAFQAEKARHQSALDQVEQVRAGLKQAQDDLSKTRIYAPMTGTVSKLNKEVGEIALGSQFQEDVIMIVSNLSGMEALVDVDENDIVSVSIGDEAQIEVDALPDETFDGVVTEIANSAKVSGSGTTDQKTEFEVKIAVTSPGSQLRPGMTASSDIVTETHDDALGVPIQSVAVRTVEQLARRSGPAGSAGASDGPGGEDEEPAAENEEPGEPEWMADKDGFVEIVFVVRDGAAEAQQVKTGIQSDTDIEILEGIEEGEEVVVGSYRAISKDLQNGSQVVVRNEDGASPANGND